VIYDRLSSICKAAIHTGTIKDEGGVVEIALTGFLPKVSGFQNYNINSFEAKNVKKTFVVGKPNSIALELAA